MNKEQLFELCRSLDLPATMESTVAEMNALLSNYKKDSGVADATQLKGRGTVTSFRYLEGKDGKIWCQVTIASKVSGIIGSQKVYKFRDMLALKDSGIQVSYQTTGENWTDRNNKVHPRYRLEWSLE